MRLTTPLTLALLLTLPAVALAHTPGTQGAASPHLIWTEECRAVRSHVHSDRGCWTCYVVEETQCQQADANHDRSVDFKDWLIFTKHFGKACSEVDGEPEADEQQELD